MDSGNGTSKQSARAAGLRYLPDVDEATEWLPKFLAKYESAGPQLADAALVYLAEREGIRTVFTLDRRDFGVYRTERGKALRNLLESPQGRRRGRRKISPAGPAP